MEGPKPLSTTYFIILLLIAASLFVTVLLVTFSYVEDKDAREKAAAMKIVTHAAQVQQPVTRARPPVQEVRVHYDSGEFDSTWIGPTYLVLPVPETDEAPPTAVSPGPEATQPAPDVTLPEGCRIYRGNWVRGGETRGKYIEVTYEARGTLRKDECADGTRFVRLRREFDTYEDGYQYWKAIQADPENEIDTFKKSLKK
ncbi:MAG: hypothetical protein RLZZ324_1102 [Candidatus Parcubacteria bacterium]|jgi:hypothetical protein